MDPEELVTGIFTTAILLVVLLILWTVRSGGDVLQLVNMVSSYAAPFVIILLVMFVISMAISEI